MCVCVGARARVCTFNILYGQEVWKISLAPEEELSFSKALVCSCFLVFCRTGDYIFLDLFY